MENKCIVMCSARDILLGLSHQPPPSSEAPLCWLEQLRMIIFIPSTCGQKGNNRIIIHHIVPIGNLYVYLKHFHTYLHLANVSSCLWWAYIINSAWQTYYLLILNSWINDCVNNLFEEILCKRKKLNCSTVIQYRISTGKRSWQSQTKHMNWNLPALDTAPKWSLFPQ